MVSQGKAQNMFGSQFYLDISFYPFTTFLVLRESTCQIEIEFENGIRLKEGERYLESDCLLYY